MTTYTYKLIIYVPGRYGKRGNWANIPDHHLVIEELVKALCHRGIPGCTVTQGTGWWMGKPEPVSLITCWLPDRVTLSDQEGFFLFMDHLLLQDIYAFETKSRFQLQSPEEMLEERV